MLWSMQLKHFICFIQNLRTVVPWGNQRRDGEDMQTPHRESPAHHKIQTNIFLAMRLTDLTPAPPAQYVI